MPHYKLPPLQPTANKSTEGPVAAGESTFPDSWDRRVTIPVSPEILAALTVGDEVSIELKGTLEELSSKRSGGNGRTTLTLSISEVEAYPALSEEAYEEAYEQDEDFERGFASRRGGRTTGFGGMY